MSGAVAGGYESPVEVINPEGRGRVVLVCEHASNLIPPHLDGLGLPRTEIERHIAWDIGALELALECSRLLDAPLVYARYSRLVLDVNRPVDAPDSIVELSEDVRIPGNCDIDPAERALRQRAIYEPFHAALAKVVESRRAADADIAVINIHSFTPVYRGVARPWHLGVLSDADRRLADGLLRELRYDAGLVVGDNEPYSPRDRVYHTLDRHAQSQGLPSVMIEVRNDGLGSRAGQCAWSVRLCRALGAALALVQRRSTQQASGVRS